MERTIIMLFTTILMLALYFLPSIIAMARSHKNTAPIIVINTFLGWTGIGWIGCLAWAFTSK